ncbi:hypothetical protein GCK72_023120 [Caenorhabditis remanei]|uniref:Uncharacterized protein n=1 Tax=Caenorhabditis remanei TaxID=31234 RepID=A0A6A5FVT8_CAERE|nr:hypothetical protein GCK72_023120 [Caenorhabditis remanei]KAF1746663.1 hypothetical protein GCK72_023120 [Caenorhabditis remanei]
MERYLEMMNAPSKPERDELSESLLALAKTFNIDPEGWKDEETPEEREEREKEAREAPIKDAEERKRVEESVQWERKYEWMRRKVKAVQEKEKKRKEEEKFSPQGIAKQNFLDMKIHVFRADFEMKDKSDPPPLLITCQVFQRCLEVMANMIADQEEVGNDHAANIGALESSELERKIDAEGIRMRFDMKGLSAAEYLKKKVLEILNNRKIQDVFEGDKVGFHLSTQDCLLALQQYYRCEALNGDNGKCPLKLSIHIEKLICATFAVMRSNNREYQMTAYTNAVIINNAK